MLTIRRLAATSCTLLAALALTAGPAGAQQDLRSPDARDAALNSSIADAMASAPESQDLRSPDTRDAATHRRAPVVVNVQRVPAPESDSGLSWDSAGIGALIAAGLFASIAGAVVLIGRRRPHGPHAA
jgi:hypothetical protein